MRNNEDKVQLDTMSMNFTGLTENKEYKYMLLRIMKYIYENLSKK